MVQVSETEMELVPTEATDEAAVVVMISVREAVSRVVVVPATAITKKSVLRRSSVRAVTYLLVRTGHLRPRLTHQQSSCSIQTYW